MFQSTTNNSLRRKLQQLTQHTLDTLKPQPKPCLLCNKIMSSSQINSTSITLINNMDTNQINICPSCIEKIPWIRELHCPICGRYEACPDCKRRRNTYFICNRSAVEYNDDMREWLAQYKYRKNERLEPLLIQMLLPAYTMMARKLTKLNQTIHAITYIPLSPERMEERSFNQAERLAQGLAAQLNIPVISTLQRTKHTPKQSYKIRADRLQDLEGVFTIDRTADGAIVHDPQQPMNLLLVDDVYTTGSTLNEAAKVLTAHHPINIYTLTFAR